MLTSEELIKSYRNLGEQYQPLWGINLDDKVSRASSDRERYILDVAKKLSEKLQRPLRVLDLGASQGYFSAGLASQGHSVIAVEYDEQNLQFLHNLKSFYNFENFEIYSGGISDFIADEHEAFDLVLCLSVLHHVYHFESASKAKTVASWISKFGTLAIFEFALSSEKYMYWSKSLPSNFWEDLVDFRYIFELGTFGNHLGAQERPLMLASNSFQLLEGKLVPHGQIKQIPVHKFVDGNINRKRFFIYNNRFYKFAFSELGAANDCELEFKNLANTKLFDSLGVHLNPSPVLVGKFYFGFSRELVRGVRLDELTDQDYSTERARQILVLYSDIKRKGHFHNDFRPWNLLSDQDNLNFIDFADISAKDLDVLGIPSALVAVLNCYYLKDPCVSWSFNNLKPLKKSQEFKEFLAGLEESFHTEFLFVNQIEIYSELTQYLSLNSDLKKLWLRIKHRIKSSIAP